MLNSSASRMPLHNDILSCPLCSTLFSHSMIYLKFKLSSSCTFSSGWPFSRPIILPSPSFYYLVKPFSFQYLLPWLPFHLYSAILRFHKLNTQSKNLRLGDMYEKGYVTFIFWVLVNSSILLRVSVLCFFNFPPYKTLIHFESLAASSTYFLVHCARLQGTPGFIFIAALSGVN